MATVHFGSIRGPAGFTRLVAVKRLHPQLASEPEFVAMFLDEASLAARVSHANVVAPLDLGEAEGELFVVFEYIHGESLAKLHALAARRGAPPPIQIVSAIVAGLLRGLHAAHEATGTAGEPLGIVHRDVSPQNVLVGADGVPRLIDFGVAKARARLTTTRDGEIKGKLAYMAPEQLRGRAVTPASDIYAAGVVLWEALAGRRLFVADSEGALIERVLIGLVDAPSVHRPEVPAALDAVVLRALDGDPTLRFASARAMAEALEAAAPPAGTAEVAAWVADIAAEALANRAARIAQIERAWGVSSAAGRAFLAEREAVVTPAPRRRLGAGRIAIGAVGLTVLAAGTLALRYGAVTASASVPTSDPATSTSPPASAASSTAAPSRSQPTSDARPGASADPEAASPPAASAPAAPIATASAAKPASAARASAPRTLAKPAATRPDCKIPFTLDALGRKSYKRECL
jgi:serine/threonine-protein kinase